jgi:hypothetical protein
MLARRPTTTKNTVLRQDLVDCVGPGLVIGADGVALDLGGHTVRGATRVESFQCDDAGCTPCDAPGIPPCGPPATPDAYVLRNPAPSERQASTTAAASTGSQSSTGRSTTTSMAFGSSAPSDWWHAISRKVRPRRFLSASSAWSNRRMGSCAASSDLRTLIGVPPGPFSTMPGQASVWVDRRTRSGTPPARSASAATRTRSSAPGSSLQSDRDLRTWKRRSQQHHPRGGSAGNDARDRLGAHGCKPRRSRSRGQLPGDAAAADRRRVEEYHRRVADEGSARAGPRAGGARSPALRGSPPGSRTPS